MVSISNLANSGLLLIGQSPFSSLASPEQASVDAYNVLNFLGGAGPYIQKEGYGIDPSIPSQCKIEQVQLLSRHGERYPSAKKGKNITKVWNKLQKQIGKFTGDLAFFNDEDYEFFITNEEYLDQEVSPKNSHSIYAGTTKALKDGAAARVKYNDLVNENSTLPVFSTNSRRCFETSKYFARGFLGDDYSEETVNHVIIDEHTGDANSLTPNKNCPIYESDSSNATDKYDTSYLSEISKRISKNSGGLELKDKEVGYLFDWCAYELNVKGTSQICTLFTNEEYIRNSYLNDLDHYYSDGPGDKFNIVIGAPVLQASLKLLKDDTANNKIWLSFAHDTNLENYLTTLGLLTPETDLTTEYIEFPYKYQHAQLIPQSGKIYTEKLLCDGELYVRFIVNDAVVPLPKYSNGPGFSTKLSDFETYLNNRIGSVNFNQQCKNNGTISNEITFYWDYETKNYDAPIGNF